MIFYKELKQGELEEALVREYFDKNLRNPKEGSDFLEKFVKDFMGKRPYFQKAISDMDIYANFIYLEKPTNTCCEKAELLGWDPERVIKIIFFQDAFYEYLVGIVTPELGKQIDTARLIPQALQEIDEKRASMFKPGSPPEGMAYGTCTPFPYESSMENKIDMILMYDHPAIDNQLTDISVGGKGKEAHKVAMHIRYRDIYKILKNSFGGKVKKVK